MARARCIADMLIAGLACALVLPASLASASSSKAAEGILVSEGHVTADGLGGSWHTQVELAGPRRNLAIDLGAYRYGEIADGNTAWRIDPSGGSHRLDR